MIRPAPGIHFAFSLHSNNGRLLPHWVSIELACLVVVLLVSYADAVDSVRRKSTKRAVFGSVTTVSRESVTVSTSSGPVNVPAGDVDFIAFENQPPVLNLGLQAEQRGTLEAALDYYRQATKMDAKDLIKTDIEYFIARTTARQALLNPELSKTAKRLLENFRTKHANSYHYYALHDWLGRIDVASGNFDDANRAFTIFGQAPWRSHKLRAQLRQAEIEQSRKNFTKAAELFDSIIQTPVQSELEKECQQEAKLGKAHCHSKQGSAADAEKMIREVIEQTDIIDTEMHARAYTLLGDCLYADRTSPNKRLKPALLAYLHVDVLPELSIHSEQHAQCLFYLSQIWKEIGKPDRAADALVRLNQRYPNNAWGKTPTNP